MGGRVPCYDLGEGPPAVLLHGFTSSFDGTWAARGWVDELLDAGHRMVGLDFPGHGASAPAAECGPERLVEDVLDVLDACGLEAPDVVGFSMGGGVALRLAGSHPQRVGRRRRSAGLDEPLPRIAAPTLLFVAGADQFMQPTECTEQWLAHAQVVRSPGRDHYQVLDDPALHRAVLEFLR